jgi:ribosomal protein L18
VLTEYLEQDVDATYMGNKTRFINNADTNLANCHAKSLMCNTVQRIGMYASVDMQPGTELFFHYNYTKEQMKGFKQPKAQIVAVKRKAKPVKTRPEHTVNMLSSDDEPLVSVRRSNGKTTMQTIAAKNAGSTTRTSSLSSFGDIEDGDHDQSYNTVAEIGNTDDEVEFQPDTAENSDGSNLGGGAAENVDEDETTTHRRGNSQQQSDRVVAVKQRGGVRNGAGRKRKR